MDVRCTNCATEYEFEKDRVPSEGLSVKCSQCGHVFRVYRDDGPVEIWKVREKSGNMFEFRELTTLQRWIVERKVARDDEISKTERNWKRLGDIAELAAFFQVVEQADTSGRPASPNGSAPVSMVSFAPAASVGPAPGPFPGGQQPAAVAPPHAGAAWTQNAPPSSGEWNATELAQPGSGSFILESNQAPMPGVPAPIAAQARAPDTDPQILTPQSLQPPALIDDEPIVAPRRSGKWLVLILVFVLLGLAAGGVYVFKPELLTSVMSLLRPKVPELAVSHLKTGYTELDKDSSAAVASAVSNFHKAGEIAGDYAGAKAGLAEALVAQAEIKTDEAAALTAKLHATPEAEKEALKKKIEALQEEANRRSEDAFGFGKEAMLLEPGGVAPIRAMANYYRFKASLPQMQRLLARSKELGPTDPRVLHVAGASLMADQASHGQAIRYFEQALEAAPGMQQARYKLAKVFVGMGKKDEAITQLERILDEVPGHDRAKALMLVLRPPEPEPAPEPKPEESPDEDALVERLFAMAERARDRDQPRKALRLYERVLEIDEGDLDALNGMAWCYFDLDQIDAAIATFKRIVTRVPRFSDAHMGLANAFEEKNMKRDAIKHYQKYLEIMPNGPESGVARAALRRLR